MKDEKTAVAHVGFEELEPADPSQPEKELLRAILVTALNDVKKSGDEKRKATEFFLSPDDDYIFSFLSICDYLKLDAKRILVVAGLGNGRNSGSPDERLD